MEKTTEDHFKGKSALEHLVEARLKGQNASSEPHGLDLSSSLFCFLEGMKNSSALLAILAVFSTQLFPLILFSLGYLLWSPLRVALLSWRRLEKMHNVIEQEKWEIEHNRESEKEELREIYRMKGFDGKLLDQVIEVLMADDNRLLETMLTEELGLSLGKMEHPLKLAFLSFSGVFLASFIGIVAFSFSPFALFGASAFFFLLTSLLQAKKEKTNPIQNAFWNLASLTLVVFVLHFAKSLLPQFLS